MSRSIVELIGVIAFPSAEVVHQLVPIERVEVLHPTTPVPSVSRTVQLLKLPPERVRSVSVPAPAPVILHSLSVSARSAPVLPMFIFPVLVPVPMFVTFAPVVFMFVAPPLTVNPALPVINPEEVSVPVISVLPLMLVTPSITISPVVLPPRVRVLF